MLPYILSGANSSKEVTIKGGTHLDISGLPYPEYHAFWRAGFNTVGDVEKYISEKGENWWKPIRGIGKARARNVEEFF